MRVSELYRIPSFKYPMIRVERTGRVHANGRREWLREDAMVADHMIVRLRNGASREDLEVLCRKHNTRIKRKMRAPQTCIVSLRSTKEDRLRNAIADFQRAKAVSYAEPDTIIYPIGMPDDTDFSELWGLHNTGQSEGTPDADIDAPEAWDLSSDASKVLIAVLDTGIDYEHPDLKANIWTNPGEIAGNCVDDDGNGYIDDVHGYDFDDLDGEPMDTHGHGSHCAGTIGAVGNNGTGVTGVCWNAKIMAAKILDGGGGTSDAVEALYYATSMGAKVTSNSWGTGSFVEALYDAVEHARDNGVLFIAAAGNSSDNLDTDPIYPAAFDLDNVIAVAAVDHNDELADFSCYGATTVDLGAPGVEIYSTAPDNDYRTMSGTSMATPHVAGACALYWSFLQGESYSDVKTRLLNQTDPLSSLSGKTVSGGRLNLCNLMLYSNDPLAVYHSNSLNDSADNDDGVIDPGESIGLTVGLRNIGANDASDVNATLSTSDSNVTVTTAAASFGDIDGSGGTTQSSTEYVIEIAPGCPTPHDVRLDLAISDSGSGSWTDSFTITVYTSGTISGTVNLDGAPLLGATITYTGPTQGSTTSAADGSYSFLSIDGNYILVASYTDASDAEASAVPTPNATVDFDFTTATISGTISDTLTGSPISGATIEYSGAHTGSTSSAGDGTYSFSEIYGQAETITITAKKTNYFDSPGLDVTTPPNVTNADITLGIPEIDISPASLTVEVEMGQTATRSISMGSVGGSQLNWHVAAEDFVTIDSNDPNGPTYNWVEIADSGYLVPGIFDDGVSDEIDIGFEFPFFDNIHETMYVCAYGYLTFEFCPGLRVNKSLPYADMPEEMIAFYWDYLFGYKMYYKQIDDSTCVIGCKDYPFWNSSGDDYLTAQVILKANGDIITQIQSADIKNECTIGLQNETQDEGLTVCKDENYVEDNMAILMRPNALWIQVPVRIGSTPATSPAKLLPAIPQPCRPRPMTMMDAMSASIRLAPGRCCSCLWRSLESV